MALGGAALREIADRRANDEHIAALTQVIEEMETRVLAEYRWDTAKWLAELRRIRALIGGEG